MILQTVRGHLTKRNIIVGGSMFVVASVAVAYWPQTISFSYAGDNCSKQLTFLPDVLKSSQNDTYMLEVSDTLNIADYPLVGSKVCIKPQGLPEKGQAKLSLAPFGIEAIGKTYKIETPEPPVLSVKPLNKPIPAAKPVVLELSSTDKIFTYNLAVKKRQVSCQPENQSVSCDISELKLEQGQSHELTIARKFKNHVETVAKKNVDILPPVQITESSVQNDQVVYDKPTELIFMTDKRVASAKMSLVRIDGEQKHEQPLKINLDDQKIIAKLDDELVRKADYQLSVTDIESVDGSVLAAEQHINFKVSGGPEVTSVNAANSGVDPNATLVLQLDQPLKPDQDITKLVKFTGGEAAVSADKDKIFIKLANLGPLYRIFG